VVVTDGHVEIRYVIPTTDHSTKTRFCHLRTDYFDHIALAVAHRINPRWAATAWSPPGPPGLLVGPLRDGVGDSAAPQQPPTRGVAVAPISNQVGGAFARPPRPWPGHPDGIQEWFQLGALMALASGDHHPQRPTAAIAG
jgi:hypothetical protein